MTLARLALSAVVVLAVPLSACGNKSHEEHSAKPESAPTHAVPVDVHAREVRPAAAPAPHPAPANAFPPVDAHGLAVDGLPSVIPGPGSAPPSVAEWNGLNYEITVKGSTAHNCETKMLREWLRVSCHPKAPFEPSGVTTRQSAGQQVFVGKFGDITSAVVQVVHGKDYQAEFVWSEGGRSTSANLHVHWPSNEPRPQIYFDR